MKFALLVPIALLAAPTASGQTQSGAYDLEADPYATVRDLAHCAAYYGMMSRRLGPTEPSYQDFAFETGQKFLRAAVTFAALYMEPEMASRTAIELFEEEMARQRIIDRDADMSAENQRTMIPRCGSLHDSAIAIDEFTRRKRFGGAAEPPPPSQR